MFKGFVDKTDMKLRFMQTTNKQVNGKEFHIVMRFLSRQMWRAQDK